MNLSRASALSGTLRYEFRMQVRRKTLWIAMALFGLPIVTGAMAPWGFNAENTEQTMDQTMANWALALQQLLPVIFGVFIADRLPRDFRFNVSEMLDTLPTPNGVRLIGKYLGSALATGLPIFLIYSTGMVYLLIDRSNPAIVPISLAVFATVIIPGLLFVAAFSIACPAILWVPLYQFLFVGYWFWGNVLSPSFGIPTLSGTILTPIGDNAAVAFFQIYPIVGRQSEYPWQIGLLSIAILLAGASLALFAAHQYLNWKRTRQ